MSRESGNVGPRLSAHEQATQRIEESTGRIMSDSYFNAILPSTKFGEYGQYPEEADHLLSWHFFWGLPQAQASETDSRMEKVPSTRMEKVPSTRVPRKS